MHIARIIVLLVTTDTLTQNAFADEEVVPVESQTVSPSVTNAPDKAVTIGLLVSEAAQYRIPNVDGVPETFSNVAGGGLALIFNWLELSGQAHFIYSYTKATVNDGVMMLNAGATGFGWDAGLRIAVGMFGQKGTQYYAFANPQFSSWRLRGDFGNGKTFDARVDEFATEFGAGIQLPVTNSVAIDLSGSILHLGFRPQSGQIVSVTYYPSIGVTVKVRLGGRDFTP
jgi:hypothetical protein